MTLPLLGELPITKNDLHPYGGINIYSKEFITQGKSLFNICDNLLFINKKDKIVEIGCGTGRILNHLSKKCNAIGIEINERFVEFANINNNVILNKVHNLEYNNKCEFECDIGYTSIDDNSVDKVISIAVLNHQTAKDARTIIKEALRITKKNGLILLTSFLINPLIISKINSSNIAFKFKQCDIDWWTINIDRPCLNSAFNESMIRKVIMQHGGLIIDPILYGQWSGNQNGIIGHDIILIKKL